MRDESVIDRKLRTMAEKGIAVAIGGLSLKSKVTDMGIKYIMTEADSDAIREAIDDALHLLKIETDKEQRRNEIENKYETINSIFNCVADGVLSIDQNGRITNINNNAKNILRDISVDTNINKIIPSNIFSNCINKGISITNEIINYKEKQLVVNVEPIKVENQTIGAVITIQKSKHIQAAEQKIRNIMLNKGHVADKTFDDIVGNSSSILFTKELAKKYAAVDSTILITGETGTGKELFAKSIHNFSNRKDSPFVAINCAAFPPSILESELFGYVKGAFTGALNQGKAGIFELAHKGTIFLDEISEAPLDVQLKLLRVIQERKIIRLGDDKIIPIDVRIITASNKNLKKQIESGLFRKDFYYRICVLELEIPSLKDRREDIPALINHFIDTGNNSVKGITNKALNILAAADWPGNIRQLSNIIERLIVICDNDIINSDIVKDTTDSLDYSIIKKEKTAYTQEPEEETADIEQFNNKNFTEDISDEEKLLKKR